MDKPKLEPRGLSRTDAARYVGVSPTTFDRLVKLKTMPPGVRLLGRRLWDRRALDTALDAVFGVRAPKNAPGVCYA